MDILDRIEKFVSEGSEDRQPLYDTLSDAGHAIIQLQRQLDEIADARKAISESGVPNRETLLDKAKKIIYGQRQIDYGKAKTNHENIAGLWSSFLGIEIGWKQVAVMMILMKLARLKTNVDHEDSWIDICGYAGVYDKGMNDE